MSRRLAPLLTAALAAALLGRCAPVLPDPPKQCDPAGIVAGEAGCLSDEICIDFKCLPRPKCELDEECPSCAFECVLPAQICELREGFGQECREPDAPCDATEFCALGLCRPRAPAGECSESLECAVGQRCDRVHFFCIPDGDCRLAGDTCAFPEVACDPTETCDALSGRCVLGCQNQCEPGSDECGGDILCDGSCRCVQCINNDDCGPGLVCNGRSGQCQSENLCFSDGDCISPLICDPRTAICQVAPPACLDDFDCAVAEVCDVATGRCVEPEGPCIDDRFEEADTPANAEELDLFPGEAVLVDSLTLCPDDDDVYSITLDAGDQLTATIQSGDGQNEQIVGSARATLWLYDSSAENALRFTQAPPFGSGRITYAAQITGIVYLRLNALSGQTPYDLLLERDSGTPCQADFFEGGGGNDDVATATPPELVPDGVALSGTVCPGDQDVFELAVAAAEALSATLAFDPIAADLDVAFVDATGTVLAQDAGADAPEFLRRRFQFAQTVYLRVRGFGTDTGSYTLTVDHEAPFVCTADAAEPDDDVTTAILVPLNQGLAAQSHTMCIGDADLLLVPLEDFERVIVRTVYDDTDVELVIDVLDAAGLNVRATSPPATGGAAVSYDAAGDEEIVIRVGGAGGAIGAYTLVITKENQLTCTPDSNEPNNTVAAASALPAPSDLLAICESDQDFFVIEGVADKRLTVDASFRQADGDIDLMLLGLDGVQILEVADGTSDGEHLEALLPLDGTYTLRVFSLTSGAKAPYSLATQIASP